MGEKFWTVREIRQGCSLSPLFFNILIADLEEELAKVRRARVRIKGSRVYSLAYTDDVFGGGGGREDEKYAGETRNISKE